jgi:8-amino-3,8-dideoxy-alpha-D-manno-octulosonate transaminase
MPGFELIGEEEFLEVKELFDKSRILFRHGFDQQRNGIYKVRDFEQAFARYMGTERALAVTSGTAALRVALAALDIERGDEVITQSFTFVATAEAIIESGATPIITEVDDTLNMDPADLKKKITSRTKAVIVVHMLGTPARMSEILPIVREKGLIVIEDTAWGCGGELNGKRLGTIGDIGTFSFDFAKTMTTGEGGMIITYHPSIHDRAAAYHDHGHENNPNLPRWEDSRQGSGFNYRMNELQGAVGLAQLRKLDQVVEAQRENCSMIMDHLRDFRNLQFRTEPEGSNGTADALVFFVDSGQQANNCRKALLEAGLGTKILPEAITWHFAGTWTHMPELITFHPNLAEAFPRSKSWLDRSVALPITVKMDPDLPRRIADVLKHVLV